MIPSRKTGRVLLIISKTHVSLGSHHEVAIANKFISKYNYSFLLGSFRYDRDNELLVIQWVDRSVVTVISTLHSGHLYTPCERFTKDRAKYEGHHKITISRPEAIGDYNKHMGGVDKSDQMI